MSSVATHHAPHTAAPDKSILIVEDEAVARRALTSLLAASGYHPRAVRSAEEALQVLEEGPTPPVALIDVDLPGMSGFDLIRRLATHNPSILPVLITASDRERIDAFRSTNPVSCLRKPIDFKDLLLLISRRQRAH